jgi:hypothetical protein
VRKLNIRRVIKLLVATVIVLTGLLITGLTLRPGLELRALAKDNDASSCTIHSARGTYGFALLGTLPIAGLVSTGGATTFDGQGNQSGKFTVTTSVSVEQFTFAGTYTVNSDCTGTATLIISPPLFGAGTVHLSAVGTNNNTELKWLVTDPGIFLAGTLTKQ